MQMPINRKSYTIQAKALTYRIGPSWCKSNKSRTLLYGVNCVAMPGEILAVVGPSGAGKTTLLEVLAGVAPATRITSGCVMVNDQPMDLSSFRRISGYVTQEDALFPLLTVEETLMYSAMLRLGSCKHEARARTRVLLKELGLEQVAGSKVGGHDGGPRGISGGERRRLSIGVDIVHDPAVLLLDEPTSGLDSASAFSVMSFLKKMAVEQAKTIVLTVHQPGYRILELFDQVLLLSDGLVVHHGTLKLLEARLEASNHAIPEHVNVLEYAIDGIRTLMVDNEPSDHPERWGDQLERHCELKEEEDGQVHTSCYANSRWREIMILQGRFCKNIFRTKILFASRTIQAAVAGVSLGTIFINMGTKDTSEALHNVIGFLAYCLTFLLSSTTEGLPIYLQERQILMRETSRGAYRVSSHVIASALIFLPFLLWVALIYASPVYWLVGLRREVYAFLYFLMVVWMALLMANSFVACFSAMVSDYILGNSLIAGFMGGFFLFSGYFITKDDIPCYWIFMHYLSLFKYPFEAFMINEYGGGGGTRCLEKERGQCTLYGKDFLQQRQLKESHKWINMGVMISFIVGYRLLCFLVLWWRRRTVGHTKLS